MTSIIANAKAAIPKSSITVIFVNDTLRSVPPTVKSRYNRLVNAGLIKAVTLDLDTRKIEAKTGKRLGSLKEKIAKHHDIKFGKGMMIELSCDYCKDSVDGKPHVLKFGNFERFFCCTSCKARYKEKYMARIEALD